MSKAIRTSPVAGQLAHLHPQWGEINGMPVVLSTGRASATSPVALIDVSCLHRWGIKGPQAAAWLAAHDVAIPPGINQWLPIAEGGVVCRLGGSEFLIEDGFAGVVAPRLAGDLRPGADGVYQVLRQDTALALCGTRANELLVQVCGFNFKTLNAHDQKVIMTMMVGVAVTVIVQPGTGSRIYRIWCDGTYGVYLWETLLGIARELGGDACGIKEIFADTSTA